MNRCDAPPSVTTPFILKLYELVNDESSRDLICWSHEPHRPGFVVLEPVQLAAQILPRYFKHANFSSFVRQLNIYGFHKVDHPQGQRFHHPNFVEGHPEQLSKIQRQQPKRIEEENAQLYRGLLQRLDDLQKENASAVNQLQQLSNMLFGLKGKLDEMENRMQGMVDCLPFMNSEPRFPNQKRMTQWK